MDWRRDTRERKQVIWKERKKERRKEKRKERKKKGGEKPTVELQAAVCGFASWSRLQAVFCCASSEVE